MPDSLGLAFGLTLGSRQATIRRIIYRWCRVRPLATVTVPETHYSRPRVKPVKQVHQVHNVHRTATVTAPARPQGMMVTAHPPVDTRHSLLASPVAAPPVRGNLPVWACSVHRDTPRHCRQDAPPAGLSSSAQASLPVSLPKRKVTVVVRGRKTVPH